MSFFRKTDNGYHTTARNILTAKRWLRDNPGGTIKTGIWTDETWTAKQFRAWFLNCLNAKINRNDPRANWRKMTPEYQIDLWRDVREVNVYYGQRVRHSGSRGLLRTPELKRHYPQVDCQPNLD